MQAYSDPEREGDAYALPDVEVFESPEARQCEGCGFVDLYGDAQECDCRDFEEYPWCEVPGWYWWTCLPGCLPDSEAQGPFETEAAALVDAREGAT